MNDDIQTMADQANLGSVMNDFYELFITRMAEVRQAKEELCVTFENMNAARFAQAFARNSAFASRKTDWEPRTCFELDRDKHDGFVPVEQDDEALPDYYPINPDEVGRPNEPAPVHTIETAPISLIEPSFDQLHSAPIKAARRLASQEERFINDVPMDNELDPWTLQGFYDYVSTPGFTIDSTGLHEFEVTGELRAVYFLIEEERDKDGV